MSVPPRVLAVVGPTAAGKTTLAMSLAEELGGEIVSADSRQVYRYMDIGTAKPSEEQRSAVTHHLIDLVDPDEDYSLALFLRHARAAIRDILSRSKLPIVAGGTGQYVRGLLEGWNVPQVPPDPALRAELEQRARDEGVGALYRELAALDPAASRRLDRRNPRRIIRALEVHHSQPKGSPRPGRRKAPDFRPTVLGLTLEREALYRRIDERVDRMISAGWVVEVEGLLGQGYGAKLPSMSGLGYQEIVRHLAGDLALDEAVQRIKHRTHGFARHQYGWFRLADKTVRWSQGTPLGIEAAVHAARQALGR